MSNSSNKKIQISIPNPCHEDWNKMTPKEQGRFCSNCQKTVIDFTKMNSDELYRYISQHKNEKICGRFRPTQLSPNTISFQIPEHNLTSTTSLRMVILVALFISMGSTLFSCTSNNGEKVAIKNIEIIKSDSLKLEEESIINSETIQNQKDSLNKSEKNKEKTKSDLPYPPPKIPEVIGEINEMEIIVSDSIMDSPNENLKNEEPTLPETTLGVIAEIDSQLIKKDHTEINMDGIEID